MRDHTILGRAGINTPHYMCLPNCAVSFKGFAAHPGDEVDKGTFFLYLLLLRKKATQTHP